MTAALLAAYARLVTSAESFARCGREFPDAPEIASEYAEGLAAALLGYERATLAPDDEHTADYAERVLYVLDHEAAALAAVTLPMLRAYLDREGSEWVQDADGWHHRSGGGVGRVPAVGEVAAREHRPLARVLADVLPRDWRAP